MRNLINKGFTGSANNLDPELKSAKSRYLYYMAEKKKYLSYIEDTRKHHEILEDVAKSSAEKAIAYSHQQSVEVTFMEGEHIIKEDSSGQKEIIGKVENNRRKVKVGAKTTIS